MDEWGEDGIICTEGGAMGQMVTAHHYYPDLPHAVAGTLYAGITKYLEQAGPSVQFALSQHLITGGNTDAARRPNFRILLRLGRHRLRRQPHDWQRQLRLGLHLRTQRGPGGRGPPVH